MLRTTYRTTAVGGSFLLIAGALTFAVLGSASAEVRHQVLGGYWPIAAAFLFGAGLGLVNSSMHISMQEAGAAYRGIATATVAFMRMVGSTFGTAALGMVLNLSLAWKLPGVHDPVQTIMDPSLKATLPAAEFSRIALAVGDSIDNVFWATLVIAIVTAALTWLVPHVRPGQLALQKAKD